MTNEHTKIIEINGVKLEIDLRHAKQIQENIKVGSRVKVLRDDYGTKVYHGVVVGFDDFANLPTICVCYIDNGYNSDLRFAYINSENKKESIVPAVDWFPNVDKSYIVNKLEKEIDKKKLEIQELEMKKVFFIERFDALFQNGLAE